MKAWRDRQAEQGRTTPRYSSIPSVFQMRARHQNHSVTRYCHREELTAQPSKCAQARFPLQHPASMHLGHSAPWIVPRASAEDLGSFSFSKR